MLHRVVFPKLRLFCQERGVGFQPIDLRWGIGSSASVTNDTVDICVAEVRRCMAESAGVFMLALLGHRYGWCPLPRTLTVADFQRLAGNTGSEHSAALLNAWYPLDRNSLSPVHVLRARVGRFLDPGIWRDEVETSLAALFDRSGLPLVSATEAELRTALSAPLDNGSPRMVAMMRTRADSPEGSPTADSLDLQPDGSLDERKHAAICRLRSVMTERLGIHAHEYTGVSGDGDSAAAALQRFGSRVEGVLQERIEQTLRLRRSDAPFASQRVPSHHQAGQQHLRDLLMEASDGLHLVHGPPGSGKSHLLNDVVQGRSSRPEVALVHTPDHGAAVEGYRSLLARWLLQLGTDTTRVTDMPYWSLCEAFRERLITTTTTRRVLLVVDAADQLTGGSLTDWLPHSDTPGLVVLASCRSESPLLTEVSRLGQMRVSEMRPWGEAQARAQLEAWLRERQRTLQVHQMEAVLSAWKQSGGWPLQLRLAFAEAMGWRSDDEPVVAISDLRQCLPDILRRLVSVRHHSDLLSRRTLQMMAATRHGLSESDLISLLSSPDVLDALRVHSGSAQAIVADVIPDFAWTRLMRDLDDLVQWRFVEGERLVSLLAPALCDAVLSDIREPDRLALHRELAQHFARQAHGSESTAQRARSCSELPIHLLKTRNWADLDDHLGSAEFLLGAVSYLRTEDAWVGITRVLAFFDQALDAGHPLPIDIRTRLLCVSNALRDEAAVLVERPELLAQQLHNQLLVHGGPDGPAYRVLEQCRHHLAGKAWFRREQGPRSATSAWRPLASDADYEMPAVSADGRTLYALRLDARHHYWIECWDLDRTTLLRRTSLRSATAAANPSLDAPLITEPPIGLHLVDAEQRLVTVLADGTLVVFDAVTLVVTDAASLGEAVVNSAASPCGRYLLLVAPSAHARVIDVNQAHATRLRIQVGLPSGRRVTLTHGCIGPDARVAYLGGVSSDSTAVLFKCDVALGQAIEVLDPALTAYFGGASGGAKSVHLMPALKSMAVRWARGWIAVGDQMGSIALLDVHADTMRAFFPGRRTAGLLHSHHPPLRPSRNTMELAELGHWKPVIDLAIDDADRLWSVGTIGDSSWDAGRSGTTEIRVWDAKEPKLLAQLHTDPRVGAIWPTSTDRADGSLICCGDGLRRLRVSMPIEGRDARAEHRLRWGRVAPDGQKRLLLNVNDLDVELWDLANHQRIQVISSAHLARMTALAWHPLERTLAAGASDGSIAVWSGHPASAVLRVKFKGRRITAAQFCEKSGDLVVAGTPGLLARVQLQEPQVVPLELPDDTYEPLCLEINADRGVFVGCTNGRILIYSREGIFRGFLSGHAADVIGIRLLDEERLISWSKDLSVICWRIDTRTEQFRRQFSGVPTHVVCTPRANACIVATPGHGLDLIDEKARLVAHLPSTDGIAECWYDINAGTLQVLPNEGPVISYSVTT